MIDIDSLRISTRLIVQEALKRGFGVEVIAPEYSYIFLKRQDFELPFLIRSTLTEMTSYAAGAICDNKWVFFKAMEKAGLPVADTLLVPFEGDDRDSDIANFLARHSQVVVKPADTNHGRGITMGLTQKDKIHEAVEHTRLFTKQDGCLVQQQCDGKDYRFLVVNGRCVAAAGRRPAFVKGDGEHTVSELINKKNQHPYRGERHASPLTKIDLELVQRYLGEERLAEVLAKDEELEVMAVANLSKGGEAIDITDQAHPELKELACQVATTLQVGVCGVDILTEDPTKSVREGGAIVLEANNSPGIRMHHFPSQGNSQNVAAVILDELIDYRLKREGKI